jgi:selenide,water dikinase
VRDHVRFETRLPQWHREIVYDPQTSGPLLFSVAAERADGLVAALRQAGSPAAAQIGEVLPHDGACLVYV